MRVVSTETAPLAVAMRCLVIRQVLFKAKQNSKFIFV
jgi:hypothetical protein